MQSRRECIPWREANRPLTGSLWASSRPERAELCFFCFFSEVEESSVSVVPLLTLLSFELQKSFEWLMIL